MNNHEKAIILHTEVAKLHGRRPSYLDLRVETSWRVLRLACTTPSIAFYFQAEASVLTHAMLFKQVFMFGIGGLGLGRLAYPLF